MDQKFMPNLSSVHGYNAHKCGYCQEKNSFATTGFTVKKMTSEDYEQLMDRGWRRCGEYYYKVNLETSCCKSYSIRLDVDKYQIRKSHQKAINKFNKFLNGGITLEEMQNKNGKKDNIMEEEKKGNTTEPSKQSASPTNEQNIASLTSICEQFLSKTAEIAQDLQQCLEIMNGTLDISADIAKKLKITQPKKNEAVFSTNFLNLIYAGNRKKFPELKLPDFISKIKTKLLTAYSSLVPSNFTMDIKENGYIMFTSTEKPEMQEETTKKKDSTNRNNKNNNPTQKENPTNDTNPSKMQEEPKQAEKSDQQQAPPTNKKIKFEIKLAKAKCDNESFEMYKKYCYDIHDKSKEDKSGYENFLCLQSLEYREEESPDKSRKLKLGCYHMKYYFDGKLVAIGVVDFTPHTMSSVYFFYDPAYKFLSFGVVGAVKEIQFIQDLKKHFPDFRYYYLGYYIQDCQKMVYKGEYEPPELLCPITYNWVTLDDKLREHIDKNSMDIQISKFLSEPVKCIEDMDFSNVNLDNFVKNQVKLYVHGDFTNVTMLSGQWKAYFTKAFKDLVTALGKKLSVDFIFALQN